MSKLIRHHLNEGLGINHNCCQTISDYLGRVELVVDELDLVVDKFYDNFYIDVVDLVNITSTDNNKRWFCLYTPYNQGPCYVKYAKTLKYDNGRLKLQELTLCPHKVFIKIINKQVSLFIDTNLIIRCDVKDVRYKLVYNSIIN